MSKEKKSSQDRPISVEGPLEWFKRAEKRAHELMRSIPQAPIYVGICGTSVAFEQLEVAQGLVVIRRVTNSPGIVQVCRAADLSKTDYLTVARYSLAIRAELAVGAGRDKKEDIDYLLDAAYHTAALIKLKHHSNLLCPSFATSSWDVISGIADNSVVFGVLDDVPRQIRGMDLEPISAADVQWVNEVWDTALDLRGMDRSRRFGLALNIAYTWNQTSNPRLALANLWCGIEALFGDKSDKPITRRVVERICQWLSPLEPAEVEESYNQRCDAIHGRWLNDEIWNSVHGAEGILRQALITCIQKNAVPLPDWS
ncbi:MAG: hypothetical protein ACE5IP_12000 [Terriglobia bacterium]